MKAAAAQATTPPQVRGANPASRPAGPPRRAATRRTRVSGRRPTALSPPDAFRPGSPASRSRAGPRTRTLFTPARNAPDPPARASLPSGRPRAPRRPPSPHLTSPRSLPEQQLCQTSESHTPPRALRPGPSRSLRCRRSLGRAEGAGRRERAEEGRGPPGRKRRGRGRTEEEAGGSARARPPPPTPARRARSRGRRRLLCPRRRRARAYTAPPDPAWPRERLVQT